MSADDAPTDEPTTTAAPPARGRPRWFRRAVASLGIVACLLVLVIGPWWHGWVESIADTGHRSATQAHLDRAFGNRPASPVPTTLLAGFGKVDLTEGLGNVPLAGYGQRAFRPNVGVADPISARAVVLANDHRRVAILSPDLLLVTRDLADRVVALLSASDPNWTREDIYFAATHTHSGPGGYSRTWAEAIGLGWRRPEIAERLAGRLADAVLQASSNLHRCRFRADAIEVPTTWIRNRTVPEDVCNRFLDVLILSPADGNARSIVIAIFAAHATCTPTSDCRLSADYPGVLCRALEERAQADAMFLAGSVGSMGPTDGTVAPREELARFLGNALADQAAVLLASGGDPRAEVAIDAVRFPIALPLAAVKVGRDWRLSPILSRWLLEPRASAHLLRLGDRVLVGTPADYSGVLALQLRDAQPGRIAIVTSFNGDYVGYIIPDGYFDLPKYEPRNMAFFGPNFGSFVQETLRDALRRFADQPTD